MLHKLARALACSLARKEVSLVVRATVFLRQPQLWLSAMEATGIGRASNRQTTPIRVLMRSMLLLWLALFMSAWVGCMATRLKPSVSPEQCIWHTGERIRNAPEREFLETLDGQFVALQEFFEQCQAAWPFCVLYRKFYCFDNEVREVVSSSTSGTIAHRVRMYYNLLSVCYPDRVDPRRTFGDVAEFYDENGVFMGLAVYMGDGLYYPLSYSGYKGRK